jgi:hypothetical protein
VWNARVAGIPHLFPNDFCELKRLGNGSQSTAVQELNSNCPTTFWDQGAPLEVAKWRVNAPWFGLEEVCLVAERI